MNPTIRGAAAAAVLLAVAGCSEEGPAERMGRAIDEAVEEVVDEARRVRDDAADAIDEAIDETDRAVDETLEEVREGVDGARG